MTGELPGIDVPLPGMPEPPAVSERKARPVYVTRYRPPARKSCFDCQTARQFGGPDVQMHPVRWRYHEGALTLHLCEIHKTERMEGP